MRALVECNYYEVEESLARQMKVEHVWWINYS